MDLLDIEKNLIRKLSYAFENEQLNRDLSESLISKIKTAFHTTCTESFENLTDNFISYIKTKSLKYRSSTLQTCIHYVVLMNQYCCNQSIVKPETFFSQMNEFVKMFVMKDEFKFCFLACDLVEQIKLFFEHSSIF